MSGPRIGELFAGYGGLGMGVQQVYGGEVVWVSEFDKGPSKILAHRFPGIPNHGDITKIDWSQVEPVDILTGGSPCQDLSHAGRRAGMTEGTRSNLWVAMREAIAQLRPALVVWENVGGALSAEADSGVEPCAGCVGDGSGVHLRALGRVLGDLASLGYDASWHSLRAADVGAPHGRLRVFVVAQDAQREGRGAAWHAAPGQAASGWTSTVTGRSGSSSSGLIEVCACGWSDEEHDPAEHRPAVALLPTPAVNDMGEGKTVDRWDEWTADMQAKHGNGNGHGKSLAIEAQRLLPTPRATDGTKGGPNQRGSSGDLMLPAAVQPGRLLPTPTSADSKASGGDPKTSNVTLTDATVRGRGLLPTPSVADVQGGRKSRSGDRNGELLLNGIAHEQRWGDYAAAIACWEHVLGRPAPAPTMTSSKGNPQLSPRFVEFLMGLPAGWVTDTPGITRNEALKALGNGVVPQQAAEALRVMAGWQVAA